ncbi:MAG TPA: hypothetical protein VM554_12785 [Acidisarcina sp.]|nr:hypothetical protein [Acidisarcina sp.]
MKYTPEWDLTTIPDALIRAEFAKRIPRKPRNLVPCVGCLAPLSARERRKPCPHCGARNPRSPL